MRKHALPLLLLTICLLAAACAPRVNVTPADDLDAAWHDFQLGLTGTLSDIGYWSLGRWAVRDLPVLHNSMWGEMVGSLDASGWRLSSCTMRCSDARLDGTIMTLTLRYGLVTSRMVDEETSRCNSTATEFRVRLDLRDVNTATLRAGRGQGGGWVQFAMTETGIELDERRFIAGHMNRCRLIPGLLQYGKWGEFVDQDDELRLRPCFIPGKLRVQFEVLVDRAKRSTPSS